ncbi:MAG: mevalonate kinase [Chlamydia sp.]
MSLPITKIAISAPSSSMLFGEHAVLRSKHAIVAAIDRFLHLEFLSSKDSTIRIESGSVTHTTSLSNPSFPPELRFIAGVVDEYQKQLASGFNIVIRSDIPQTVGLGSSAAVTAALVAAFELFLSQSRSLDLGLTTRQAIKIVQKVQGGRGSGADVASVIHGGVILFNADSLEVFRLSDRLPITLVYSGSKTPTPIVIAKVQKDEDSFPEIYRKIFDSIESITQEAIFSIKNRDFVRLGACMNMAQGCMETIQVSTKRLSDILWSLRDDPQVYGAKISGSGLGDSVIALGAVSKVSLGDIVLGAITPIGLQIEVKYE